MLPFLLVPVAIVSALTSGNPSMLIPVAHGLAFGCVASWMAWHKNPDPVIEPNSALVEDAALVVGDEQIPLGDLENGIILRTKRGLVVRLSRGLTKLPIDLGVRTEAEGKALLTQAGLAGHQTVANFRGLSPIQLMPPWKLMLSSFAIMALGACLGFLMTARLGNPSLFIPAAAGLMVAYSLLLALPQRIDVGADGIRLRWLGRERFIPIDDVARVYVKKVSSFNRGRMVMTIERHDDEPVLVALGVVQNDYGKAEAVAARVRWVMESSGQVEEDATARLRRGDQSLQDWIQYLRGLEQQASHRRASASRRALWSTLEAPRATPLDRAAAAIALRDRLLPEERRRMATTARATAAPRLRLAFERALDEDDEALLEALADLEEDQGASQVIHRRRETLPGRV